MSQDATLLVVDDDPDVLGAARLLLKKHYTRVLTTDNPHHIETLMTGEHIDVFLVDMNFAIGRNTGAEGLHWLNRILEFDADAVVILMTAFGDLNTAVQAMREGAADFVLKPWQNDKLVATLNVAVALRKSRTTLNALNAPRPPSDMIAGSDVMQKVLRVVGRVAPTQADVLILGENGTGKELIAQALHRQSTRAHKSLVTVDLGAVPESLFESELFGHTKGAFTGADSRRAGRFLAAHEGTLFLDEIGNLPLALQAKLLRTLESREVVSLGSDQPERIDVRLIAATNQPLDQMVASGAFREDLLYRLNTIEIRLPPLRERLDDLPALVRHFIKQSARKYRLAEKTVTEKTCAALCQHHWPGNVRELAHAVERAMILGDREELGVNDFALDTGALNRESSSLNLESHEKNMIKEALSRTGGNISHAAEALGITRAALYRRMEKYHL